MKILHNMMLCHLSGIEINYLLIRTLMLKKRNFTGKLNFKLYPESPWKS